MVTIEKRIITREITQKIMLPVDRSMPIKEQCEKALVQRLKGIPSDWGVMIEDHLKTIIVAENASLISYGTDVYLSVPVKASFEVVGYLRGDVLFGVSLAERAADDISFSQFKRANIVGLPFQIEVKTRHDIEKVSIQIVDARIEGSLQYMAVPAFYPHYAPLVANLIATGEGGPQFLSLYRETPSPTIVASDIGPIEMRLIDPLHGRTSGERRQRIVADIERMLGITPTYLGGKKIALVNPDAPFGGKAMTSKLVADETHPVMIEFIEAEQVERKEGVFAQATTSKVAPGHTFIRVPSIPPLSSIVAVVSWIDPLPLVTSPSKEQIILFAESVAAIVKFHKLEVIANRIVYGTKLLSDERAAEGKSGVAALLREHLEAGQKIVTGLAIETPAKPTAEGKRKEIIARAAVEGGPLQITPTEERKEAVKTRMRKGSGRK